MKDTIDSKFHDAIILSIVVVTRENEGIGIFEIIKLMISETNKILSPGSVDFGPSSISKCVRLYIEGEYCYPLISRQYGTPIDGTLKIYIECLVKIHESLNGDWEVSWYELLTYLLFIQSNCHHKGNINSHKLCMSPDSFLNFFYKSKNAFNPWSRWEESDNIRYGRPIEDIPKTKTAELRGEWWVEAFKREKKILLMFETLAPSHYLGRRLTTGWVVRGFKSEERDILPQGSVLNQLRRYYNLPELSGDYGLGCMSVNRDMSYEFEVKKKDNFEKKDEGVIVCELFNLAIWSISVICLSRFVSTR